MIGRGAMTRFASDIDLRPRRLELIGSGIVSLTQRRRMTVGTHEVPHLLPAGPMKIVSVGDARPRIERKPSLPARRRST